MSESIVKPVKRAVERARLAGLASQRPADDPELMEAQRAYKALALRDHIERVVDSLPPLSREQRAELAALLRPTQSELGR